jgi:hypothetical protein
MECTEEQHQENITLPLVRELAEAKAVELAARFQPARTVIRHKGHESKKEALELPELDLKKFIKEIKDARNAAPAEAPVHAEAAR